MTIEDLTNELFKAVASKINPLIEEHGRDKYALVALGVILMKHAEIIFTTIGDREMAAEQFAAFTQRLIKGKEEKL